MWRKCAWNIIQFTSIQQLVAFFCLFPSCLAPRPLLNAGVLVNLWPSVSHWHVVTASGCYHNDCPHLGWRNSFYSTALEQDVKKTALIRTREAPRQSASLTSCITLQGGGDDLADQRNEITPVDLLPHLWDTPYIYPNYRSVNYLQKPKSV